MSNIPKSSRRAPSIFRRVEAAILAGKSTPEIIAKNPDLKADTIANYAAKSRAKLGLPKQASGQPLVLPFGLNNALVKAARSRGERSGNTLALRLLAVIAEDDLFEAVLGGANDRRL